MQENQSEPAVNVARRDVSPTNIIGGKSMFLLFIEDLNKYMFDS